MMPTWVGVVSALSLAVLALAGVALALAHLVAARQLLRVLRLFDELAGPAVGDVRHLIATIRAEVDGIGATSRDLRGRVVRAADAAEARLADLDALVGVVQEEVEGAAIDLAASLRTVRRGLSLAEWGRRALKRGRKR